MAVGYRSPFSRPMGGLAMVPPEIVSNAYRRMDASVFAHRERKKHPHIEYYYDPRMWDFSTEEEEVIMYLLMN